MADLKAVYAAVDEPSAQSALNPLKKPGRNKYPRIAASWREKLSPYFKFPQAVHRLIDTTNATEGFNRQLRQPAENAVSRHDGHDEEMDRAAAGLERHSCQGGEQDTLPAALINFDFSTDFLKFTQNWGIDPSQHRDVVQSGLLMLHVLFAQNGVKEKHQPLYQKLVLTMVLKAGLEPARP